VPHTPGFPVNVDGVGKLHTAFLNESRTRGRCLGPRTGNPGISLVFREIWDTADLNCSSHRVREVEVQVGPLRPVHFRSLCSILPFARHYASIAMSSLLLALIGTWRRRECI
jgi:hypothetical protein